VETEVAPAVGRRRLAAELRRLRVDAGLTIQDAARALDCSVGKVSRVENGLVGARIQDVRDLLDLYAVTDPQRATLLELVRQARRKAWWHAYTDVVPAESAKYFGLEDGAATIQEYATVLVPGLFQTEAYAGALLAAARSTAPDVIRRRLELRLRRQQLLTRDTPPTVEVVLHELVLLNSMSGAEVTREQLHRLLELARRPHITIRVLPMAAGPHRAAGVPFTIFGFTEDASVAYHEQPTRNSFVDTEDEVAWYQSAFAETVQLALPARRSLEAIKHAANSLG
jgi:transcriptional regulator with XRE-family HTH domain